MKRTAGIRKVAGALALAFALGAGLPAFAKPEGTGLPLPRFVSLRADKVHMRTGPGMRYPIEWVYQREKLPVEIIAEYKQWRKVRDWTNAQGWVHQSMLAGTRTLVVTETIRTLYSEPSPQSRPVARVEPGVVGNIIQCPGQNDWCHVRLGEQKGWLPRADFWGLQPDEVVQ